MSAKEKCDLIEATLPRFFSVSSDASKLFVVSRKCAPKFYPRECVVIESTSGVFNAWWLREFSYSYTFFFYDNKLWIQSVRNLNLICSAL